MSDDQLIETPDLPETLAEVREIDDAYTLEFTDGSTYTLSGLEVLAVWLKYGRGNWDRWVVAACDHVTEWYHENRVPARFGHRTVRDGEMMADLAADKGLYYGDLRATLMQLALTSLADDDPEAEPVTVTALTPDGPVEYPDPTDVLTGGEDDE